MNTWGAALYLESGHLFRGMGFGAKKALGGEIVFNTGMLGYQEILTDPSYKNQIVVMTAPHVGNTGVNHDDIESLGVHLNGFVVRELTQLPSNWRAQSTLHDYLDGAGVPGITDVDTRAITLAIREGGAQRAVIFPTAEAGGKDLAVYARGLLLDVPSMDGLELVSQVSCRSAYEFNEDDGRADDPTAVVYDFGVKLNILRLWKSRGFRVHVVPQDYPHQEVLKLKPSVVVLSNGPGDPAEVGKPVQEIQSLIGQVPIFSICMGHQLLARALGYSTFKLKFGHHGVNQPVQDLLTGKILITSQNHGFAVDLSSQAEKSVKLSHVNLNDQTVEGFCSEKLRLYSVQFHPESKPGPNDASELLDYFIKGFVQ